MWKRFQPGEGPSWALSMNVNSSWTFVWSSTPPPPTSQWSWARRVTSHCCISCPCCSRTYDPEINKQEQRAGQRRQRPAPQPQLVMAVPRNRPHSQILSLTYQDFWAVLLDMQGLSDEMWEIVKILEAIIHCSYSKYLYSNIVKLFEWEG